MGSIKEIFSPAGGRAKEGGCGAQKIESHKILGCDLGMEDEHLCHGMRYGSSIVGLCDETITALLNRLLTGWSIRRTLEGRAC